MLDLLSFLSNECNKASPGSLQTSSRTSLSSCSHKNLGALHSWCLPFLPSPALQHEMYVLFLHREVSCKDSLDYSHLVLRINLDSFNAGLAAVLSQSPDHKSLETFTLLAYFPTAQPHDFRINIEYQRENSLQKVLILSEGVKSQQKNCKERCN